MTTISYPIATIARELSGADEERVLARLRALRSELIDSSIALYHGRIGGGRLLRSTF
jgi:hypothetical protein